MRSANLRARGGRGHWAPPPRAPTPGRGGGALPPRLWGLADGSETGRRAGHAQLPGAGLASRKPVRCRRGAGRGARRARGTRCSCGRAEEEEPGRDRTRAPRGAPDPAAAAPVPPQGRGGLRLASAGRGGTSAAAAASSPPAPAGPRPGAVGHGAVEAVRAVAHPLQGAAGQPPGDLGLGAGVRPGADPPRWSPALSAAQQSPGALHQPEGDQPEAADVPGKGAGAGASASSRRLPLISRLISLCKCKHLGALSLPCLPAFSFGDCFGFSYLGLKWFRWFRSLAEC